MSIKERMAAFQQAAQKPAAPPPRPAAKPANWAWKQKQAEVVAGAAAAPTSSASVALQAYTRDVPQADERSDRKTGMSASDAQESIKGQSLKERMAALQKGFAAAPDPAPRPPASEKPRAWKRPVVPASTDEDSNDVVVAPSLPISLQPVRSPSHEPENPVEGDTLSPPGGEETEAANVPEGDEEDVDEEEKERQRRAAIAARMAKLGGARVGMGPPIFSRPAPSPSASVGSATEGVWSQSTISRYSAYSSLVTGPSRKTSTESPDAPATAARIPLPSLSSPPFATESPIPPVETSSSGDKEVKSQPLSVPKRALPPRKKSAKKQTSTESESSIALLPATIAEDESVRAPVVATPGEVEGEIELRAQPHAENEASAHIPAVDEATVPGEDAKRGSGIDEEIVPAPVPVDTTVVIKPPSTIVEPTLTTSYNAEVPDTDQTCAPLSPENLAPISTIKTAEMADPGAEVDLASPATALGQNAMALLADEEDYTGETDRFVPPPPPQALMPTALRSQLDEEEEPEEDTWDEEVPPVRSSIPPPPRPSLLTRIEHERSETHTPVPPVATRPPVPAGLASAVPTSPPSRPVPVPVRSESPVSPPSRQGSIPERPARRSIPPPPPPPPVERDEEDEKEEVEQEEGGAVGEGAHH
jgi:hypothetical protein